MSAISSGLVSLVSRRLNEALEKEQETIAVARYRRTHLRRATASLHACEASDEDILRYLEAEKRIREARRDEPND